MDRLFPEWAYGTWVLVIVAALAIVALTYNLLDGWGMFPGVVLGAWAAGGAYVERLNGFPNTRRRKP